jgi:hypothetical protein
MKGGLFRVFLVVPGLPVEKKTKPRIELIGSRKLTVERSARVYVAVFFLFLFL